MTDFLLRGLLQYPIDFYYGFEARCRAYYIADSFSYLFLYLLIFKLAKRADLKAVCVIVGAAIPFALNKCFESIFMNSADFDWTEILFLGMSVLWLIYKFKKNKIAI